MIAITKQTGELRYVYLGRTTRGFYIYLESDLAPDQIIIRNERKILRSGSFTSDPTNWGGCDDLDRVCKLRNVQPQEHIPLIEHLLFYGCDFDHGHKYDWSVEVDMLLTVK